MDKPSAKYYPNCQDQDRRITASFNSSFFLQSGSQTDTRTTIRPEKAEHWGGGTLLRYGGIYFGQSYAEPLSVQEEGDRKVTASAGKTNGKNDLRLLMSDSCIMRFTGRKRLGDVYQQFWPNRMCALLCTVSGGKTEAYLKGFGIPGTTGRGRG